MIYQKQVGQTCMLYSASMVMGIPVSDLVIMLGHDGTEPYKTLPHKGIHMQEIQCIALAMGHHFYPIHPFPELSNNGVRRAIWDPEMAMELFEQHVDGHAGMMIGTNYAGNDHAVAYCHEDGVLMIYDPASGITDLEGTRFSVREVWVYV